MAAAGTMHHTYQIDTNLNAMDKQYKATRDFTDLPAPYYSKRGELISHKSNTQLSRQTENGDDQFGTINSMQSILSGTTISSRDSIKDFEESDPIRPTSIADAQESKIIFSSATVSSSHGSTEITRETIEVSEVKRIVFSDGEGNPSTPSDFSHFTKESVYDESDKSSSEESPMDLETLRKVMHKWILLSIAVLVAYAIFSLSYQLIHSLYISRDDLNEKPVPSNQTLEEVNSYITAHPENKIGLWMECNEFSCRDLPLYCSADVIQKRLIDSGLAKFATQEQTDDFVKNQLHVCPMIRVSRFTSVLSIFAAVIALIGLLMALRNNQSHLFTFIKVGGFLMVLFTTISFSLFIAIKEILDHLVSLAKSYSDTGSSTPLPYIDTYYYYSVSFWLCCLSLILSMILLALFFVMSKSADKLRDEQKDINRKSDSYSVSTMESVDFGPRVSLQSPFSQDSSTIRFNDSIHNLTETSSMEPTESFEAPPFSAESKAVRFS